MAESNDSADGGKDVDASPWLKPLAELGEGEFSEVVKMEDLDWIGETFYPHAPQGDPNDKAALSLNIEASTEVG